MKHLSISIPGDWTAEQVEAVIDALDAIQIAIFTGYEQQLAFEATPRFNLSNPDEENEDDLF